MMLILVRPLRKLRVLSSRIRKNLCRRSRSLSSYPKKNEKELENEKEKEKKKEKEKGAEIFVATQRDVAQDPEVTHITGLDQPFKEKEKETAQHMEPEVVKSTEPAQPDAPTQTAQVTSAAGGSAATTPE
ncbi:putative G-protein gamma [Helianthus anomalus]